MIQALGKREVNIEKIGRGEALPIYRRSADMSALSYAALAGAFNISER
jgi:hypothetical protein